VSVAGDASPYQLQTIYSVNPIGAAYANDAGSKFNYATLGNEVKNAFLKPEITSEIEAGLELRMFKNRVNFDLTLFRKRTKDQIIAVSSPRSTGFSSRVVNAGEVENKGIELGITTTNIQTSDFKWTSIFNFNLIRSLVLDAGPTGEIF
jgi:outer membrane receptor protein involved in Fe transport